MSSTLELQVRESQKYIHISYGKVVVYLRIAMKA